MSIRNGTEKALNMLKGLPRVCLANLRDNPGSRPTRKRGRGQHGGFTHGAGTKGSGQRQNFMRVGYETGNTPFYLRFGWEGYYKGHHLRRQYPPLSLSSLQLMIDTNRIDASQPIDLTQILRTGVYNIQPASKHFGVQLTDEGLDKFNAKINIEVQWATEQVIAAIERNGGTITTAYYDFYSLMVLKKPEQFFKKGVEIPKRLIPPMDAIEYYSDPKFRGYLANPDDVNKERLVLAQKYGYELPKIEDDPDYEMLASRKDPRQIFYGLEPGWVVNLKDKVILKPNGTTGEEKQLKEFYVS